MSAAKPGEHEGEYEAERGGELKRAPPEIEPGPRRSLSLGFLAMLPLLAAYEWALAGAPQGPRNAAEALLSLVLVPFGEHSAHVRWGLLAGLAAAAWALTRWRGSRARIGVARVLLEGLAAALLLGPLLVAAMGVLDVRPPLDEAWDPTASPPALTRAALAAGGAVWEELAFRVGLYSLLYLAVRRALAAMGSPGAAARWGAEAAGALGSAAAFAAFHFRRFTSWLYPGGLEWDAAGFTWVFLAGILLGVLFRWRGPGVAAWCHGLFNLALLIGIDPEVLQ